MNKVLEITSCRQALKSLGPLIVVALIFSTILNYPNVLTWFQGGAGFIFNDIDEVYYLQKMHNVAHSESPLSFYLEHKSTIPIRENLSAEPSRISEFLLGKFGSFFELSSIEVGAFCDFLCPFVSYILAVLFFSFFGVSKFTAHVASIISLAFPWVFSFSQYIQISPWWSSSLLSSDYKMEGRGYPFLPILRGVGTQLSIPILLLVLIMISQCLWFDRKRGALWAALAGTITGLLLYVYFHAWVAAGFLCFLLFLYHTCKEEGRSIRKLLIYCFTATLVSIPGLVIISNQPHDFSFLELRQYWYLPLERVVFVPLFLLLSSREISENLRRGIVLIIAMQIAEVGLMNLQPLLGYPLVPYHFGEFYYHPLTSGFICVLIELLAPHSLIQLKHRQAFLGAIVFALVWSVVLSNRESFHNRINVLSLAEFSKSNLKANDVVAMSAVYAPFRDTFPRTFALSPIPSAYHQLSGQPLLHQSWVMLNSSSMMKEQLHREMFVAWLHTGILQLYWSCPEAEGTIPGDVFSLTWSYYFLYAKRQCEILKSAPVTACELVKSFQVNYLIWSTLELPPNLKPPFFAGNPVWQTTDGALTMYKIDRQAMIASACSS
jgi:hypothetical protein